MTNAPYTLNVDCDMYANEPDVVRQAMCVFLQNSKNSNHCAFVQFPQKFYDSYTNELAVLQSVSFLLLFDQFNVSFFFCTNSVLIIDQNFDLFFFSNLDFGTRSCWNPRTILYWNRMLPH